ncbi:MAG: type II toxin-antitoxin system RelE/ParE family toxin [Vicingaceae bacterium]|nr:type II toxin-antitoxin system RelE/ParE family toxin [Vicingaceae bacterium]
MAKQKINIEWNKKASVNFYKILEYLNKESETAAFIVGNAILDEVEKLITHSTAHPLDRFKRNNDGNYRACIVYSYRISYYLFDDTIYILRIRHTSREPLEL